MERNKIFSKFIVLSLLGFGLLLAGGAPVRQVKPEEQFTLVVLPDSQCYADTRIGFAARHWKNGDLRKYLLGQMQWIKENKNKLNIVMVAHVGDIVQADHEEEWKIADKAFKTIDNVVPYILCLGNHDFGYEENPEGPSRFRFAANRGAANYNNYFGPSRFEGKPWYGGHFGEGNENYYCLFEAGGAKFLIISLEFNPRDEVLAWANEVVGQHPDRQCIVLTHSYLNSKNERLIKDPYCRIEGNAGEAVWEKFVSRHENIFLLLCGHMGGEGQLTSIGQKGNKVHQILANYQYTNDGGEGYLRVITFIPEEDTIKTQTYSPVLNKYNTTVKSQFSLEHRMKGKAKADTVKK
jgi:hypothetical protein